ncbi:MAG: NAD(P)/FAD-dependent oxidoreductase [Lachnospiraceae bacterium]|nr:NAD(P)/FAD-dependent oxidoreductase [Candidatus Minthocola equi]
MKVIVIGAGASGLLAAISAAQEGHDVTVFEKNEKAGKKIYITGKGRCNVTNACDRDEFFEHILRNPRFAYSMFSSLGNDDMMKLLEDAGLSLKIERGQRVFPQSDKASDVTKTLVSLAERLGAKFTYNAEVSNLICDESACHGVIVNGQKVSADAVIVATGGLSYPATGSTGDGYKFADEAGLEVTETSPSLVPFTATIDGYDISELAGLSLKNVKAGLYKNGTCLESEFGEMLFTHTGVSGPIILTLSARCEDVKDTQLRIDLKPALTDEQLDDRLLREFDAAQNKAISNVMRTLLPASLITPVLIQSGIKPQAPIHEITKAERIALVKTLKAFALIVCDRRGFDEAVITRGGVKVSELNPKTMQAKKVKGLSFAGEVIDIDATTGGFNLQLAFSSGYAAGKGVSHE